METGLPEQEITLRLSAHDIEVLNFLGQSWGTTVSGAVKALLPSLPHPAAGNISHQKKGPLKILPSFDRARLAEIVADLISQGKAVTLAREVRSQILDCDYPRENLTRTTEARLLRWATPRRVDARTEYASPKAVEMCQILYDFVPDRND